MMFSRPWRPDPPGPDGARSVGDLAARLRDLQAWAGMSVRDIHLRVVQLRQARGVPELPALDTVHRCLKPGRTRLDVELVADVARALLGDDAGAAVWRRAHQAVTARAAMAAVVVVRNGLPDDNARFVGRRVELELLHDWAIGSRTAAVLDGMAGVGKTTLAVHAAHQLVAGGHFIDVQLSVNLRGHDPEHSPADPFAVLDAMLRALGCPPHQIRDLNLHDRTAWLRRMLVGRRAIILLDNAASEAQVRPLLADHSTCLTLVTSRRRLIGLADAHLSLGPFAAEDARDLLSSVVGVDRVAAESEAAAGITEIVGRLPLALAVVADRIRATPSWTLQDHLARLAERKANLAMDRSLAIAIESSYADQSPQGQRLLRLLAIHPGRDVDVHAAAALAGVDLDHARRDLYALARDNLLMRWTPDRFEMHDLVRLFAADRASDVDAQKVRAVALDRLFDYYRFATYTAAKLIGAHYQWPMELDRPDLLPSAIADRSTAEVWLATERPNLIACALYCTSHDRPRYASDLSALLHHPLYLSGHMHEAELLDHHVAQATSGIDQARALARRGAACSWLGRLAEADRYYRRALEIIRVDGTPDIEARCLSNYAIQCQRLGRFAEALECHQRAIRLFGEVGNDAFVALQLANVGYIQVLTGQQAEGVDSLCRALVVARDTLDRTAEADLLCYLGYAAEVAGRPAEALDLHRRALQLFQELGDRPGEGLAYNGCGVAHTALGNPELALACHRQALDIAREVGDREGEATALTDAGRALCVQGKLEDALDQHKQALQLAELSGNPWQQARAHDGNACVLAALGDLDSARASWRRALVLHTELGTREVDLIAAQLNRIEPSKRQNISIFSELPATTAPANPRS